MIAIDTNVLLRRLLDDDPAQSEKARDLFHHAGKILITDVVLAETLWTLKGKRYKALKEDLVAVISSLLAEPNIVFESQQAVWSALNEFIHTPPVRTTDGTRSVDFPDALIVNKAKIVIQASDAPYDGTYTFDQAAQQLDSARVP